MKKLYRWQHLLKREQLTLLLGGLVLLLGVLFPWYQLPSQALKAFEANLLLTNFGRCMAAFFAFASLAFSSRLVTNRMSRCIFLTGLIITLLFPYFMLNWSPSIAFLTSSYYEQGETVSTHIDQNFPQVQAQWKQEILLHKPELPPLNINLSIPDSRFFQMSSWDQWLVEGLGYKNSFFTFIGKGWIFTIFGLIISLIGLYLSSLKSTFVESNEGLLLPSLKFDKSENTYLSAFLIDISQLLPGISLLLVIIFISIIGINVSRYQIDTQFAKGEYSQVIANSKTLMKWCPALQGSTSFVERLAKAEFYAEVPDPPLVNFVKGIEYYRNNDFDSAVIYLRKSLELQPKNFLFRGYLAAAMLNQGVNYLNKSQDREPAAAADIFERVLEVFPGHLEALYDLMLARVVNGEFQKSAAVAKQIIAEQKSFQEQKIGLLGQAYLHLAWAEYQGGDVNKTWERYRQSIDMKTWGKSALEVQQ